MIERVAIERALSRLDLALGLLSLGVAIGLALVVTIPATRSWDPLGFGVFGAMMLLPYGFVALAAWNAMRLRDRGRWVLQALTLAPLPLVVAALSLR